MTPGLTLPVRFTVRNTGTATLDSVTVKVDDQTETFGGLSLLPNESAQLTLLYEVPESVTDDPEYEVTVPEAEAAEGWLLLNRPDVGIADMKLLREGDGTRDIQVRLENDSNIPLSGNHQTVKLAFYKDSKLKNQVAEYTVPTERLADIDEGLYTYKATLSVRDLIGEAEEIPEAGVTVYAKAWLEHDGNEFEYDTSNNSASLFFNGLLTKYEEVTTMDSALLTNGSGGYTVQADIRNNSLRETDLGDIIVDVLDSDNKVLESVKIHPPAWPRYACP